MKSLQSNFYILQQLITSEFQTKYKRSFIGSFWLLIEPLLSVVIWIFLFKTGIIRPGNTNISYASYILLSTSLWSIFNSSFIHTSSTIRNYQRLFITIKVNPIHFIYSRLGLAYIYSIIPILLITLLMLIEDINFSFLWFLTPIAIIPLLLAGGALGLINSLLTVVAVDAGKLVTYLIQLLKYATPVIYAPDIANPLLNYISNLNPISTLLGFPRDLIVGTSYYSATHFIITSLVIVLGFLFTQYYFRIKFRSVLERIIV